MMSDDNVKQIPMNWAVAYRLVANELGVSREQLASWVDEANLLPYGQRESWLTNKMFKSVIKKSMKVIR